MEDMMRVMGVDVDLSEFSLNDSVEEMTRKFQKIEETLKLDAEIREAQNLNRKTKRQLLKEEMERKKEAAKERTISVIYKQLAKILHPDLEQDADLKAEKEELMKQVTVAYEKSDLHTLLSRELAWVNRETDHLELLSEEKVKIYNELLKEQVQELNMAINNLVTHPQYAPFRHYVEHPSFFSISQLKMSAETIKRKVSSLNESIMMMENGHCAQELNKFILYQRRKGSAE